MKLTLKQFFEKYPMTASGVAKHFGYSREWLSGMITGRMYLRPQTRKQHLEMIQKYINETGQQMAQIELIDE